MSNPYNTLISELKRIFHITSIESLLFWDEQVLLPKNSSGFRAQQMATLAEVSHDLLTSPKIGMCLDQLEKNADLTNEQKVVVKQTRKKYSRLKKLPKQFVSRKKETHSNSFQAWKSAREQNDFSIFEPHLKKNIELAREEAHLMDFIDNPYDYWVDQFDPEMESNTLTRLFNDIKTGLKPILDQILESNTQTRLNELKGFPIDQQEAFSKLVSEKLGFDYTKGRLDKSVHPFCSGHAFDCRLTTRFSNDSPLQSLFATIHETGHGLYCQGLPLQHQGTPLGEAVGMGVHESQSRQYENQVGRSRAFWKYWEPTYREFFSEQLSNFSSDDLYLAINTVNLTPIRLYADELTYNLHIILRFELEKKLILNELNVKDLPEAWNDMSEQIIGYRPKNNGEGVLQDIHWSYGLFGYFPTYSIGNMLASQLWHTFKEENPKYEDSFEQGDFSSILKFSQKNIYNFGQTYDTQELTQKVTGKPLSAQYLLDYLEDRYLPLYTAKARC